MHWQEAIAGYAQSIQMKQLEELGRLHIQRGMVANAKPPVPGRFGDP